MTKRERQVLRVALTLLMPSRTETDRARQLHRITALDVLIKQGRKPYPLVTLNVQKS